LEFWSRKGLFKGIFGGHLQLYGQCLKPGILREIFAFLGLFMLLLSKWYVVQKA
jgi:TM2 domain-containing membrane protein YozV